MDGLRSQIANGPRTTPPRVPAMRAWTAFCSGVRFSGFKSSTRGILRSLPVASRRRVSDNRRLIRPQGRTMLSVLSSPLPPARPLTGGRRYFLGVEQSATGRAWCDRLDERGAARALAIAQRHDLPDLLARVLAGRGVEIEDAAGYLDPTVRTL